MSPPGERTLRLLLAPINAALTDPLVTEVVVNRPREVGVERRGTWSWVEAPDLTYARLDALATLAAALTQQDVGPARPLCATRLPDGERLQICRPPAVAPGTISLTIRRPTAFVPTLAGLAAGGLFSATRGGVDLDPPADEKLKALHRAHDWPAFFALAVQARKTILVTGETGSGKTTFAKALIQAIPLEERLVTIEDTPEFVGLPHRNLVQLFYSKGEQGLGSLAPEDLIEASLRLRPDRVLMQELRDGAAFTFLRALAAGHPGAITTCHAGSAERAFEALRLMVKQHPAGRHLEDGDVKALLRQLIDVVVHCRRAGARFWIEQVLFAPSGHGVLPSLAPAAE